MNISITKWDKYPFAFSAFILPTIVIFVFFRHKIPSHIDDFVWMTIVFALALCAIGFTFWCKWKEDELGRYNKKR